MSSPVGWHIGTMPIFSLEGDQSGLPRTTRSDIPYEIDALSPREVWGAGNGNTSIICRQFWDGSAAWIRDMVGEVAIEKPGSQVILRRYVPEMVQYGDDRVQFCSIAEQVEQGGNATGGNFSQAGTNWPQTDWCKYRAVFEVFPYAILSDTERDTIATAAGAYAGAKELYRYVIRSRRMGSKEQPIPAASTAGGFKDTTTGKPIGQVGFRAVEFADIAYKWIRVPISWPPPIGWTPPASPPFWPPPFNPAALDPTANKRARDAYINSVNHDWFDVAAPDGYAFPPGTLLYTGYDDSAKYFDAAGAWVCDVVYHFRFKGALDSAGSYGGWNYALNAKGQWVYVNLEGAVGGATDTPPYQSKNFNHLFQYA